MDGSFEERASSRLLVYTAKSFFFPSFPPRGKRDLSSSSFLAMPSVFPVFGYCLVAHRSPRGGSGTQFICPCMGFTGL